MNRQYLLSVSVYLLTGLVETQKVEWKEKSKDLLQCPPGFGSNTDTQISGLMVLLELEYFCIQLLKFS